MSKASRHDYWKAQWDKNQVGVIARLIEYEDEIARLNKQQPVAHLLKLSNERYLRIHEGVNSITLEADGMCICKINSSGVLVMSDSGSTTEFLTRGLK